ncbi:MAG: translation initiation factor 2 [Solibacillus sp.]|jgi:hypothetical protein|uniref:translation initiation factor 2 n=1 Tax=unclassified Solibacillus TaxID=2637870 RepID=UPI0030F5C4EB
MPIIRTVRKSSVAQAMFFGGLTGLVGVIVFIFILQLPSNEQQEDELASTTQVSSEQEVVSQSFFALQHGVFSNFDSAAQFLASYPTLNKSTIFEVDDQYYIWSQLDQEKVEGATLTTPSSFYKKMTLSSSCPTTSELQLPNLLMDEKWLSVETLTDAQQANVPKDWGTNLAEVQKLTNQVNVIRLHMLMNYYEQLDCLKVTF